MASQYPFQWSSRLRRICGSNGDGIPDLAIGLEMGNGISILLGTGKALSPYTQGELIPVSAYICPLTGDLNRDDISDLFVTTTAGTTSNGGRQAGLCVGFELASLR
jgi:hypothetical protein